MQNMDEAFPAFMVKIFEHLVILSFQLNEYSPVGRLDASHMECPTNPAKPISSRNIYRAFLRCYPSWGLIKNLSVMTFRRQLSRNQGFQWCCIIDIYSKELSQHTEPISVPVLKQRPLRHFSVLPTYISKGKLVDNKLTGLPWYENLQLGPERGLQVQRRAPHCQSRANRFPCGFNLSGIDLIGTGNSTLCLLHENQCWDSSMEDPGARSY